MLNTTLIDTSLLNIICTNIEFDFLFEIIEEAGFVLFSEDELFNWKEDNELFVKKLVGHFSDALNVKLTGEHAQYNLTFADVWNQRFHIKKGIVNPQYVLTFEYNPNLINTIYKPDDSGLNDNLLIAFGEYEFNKAFQKILNGEVKTLSEAGLRINVYTNMSGCSFWIKVSLVQENLQEMEVLKTYQEKMKVWQELQFMEELLKNLEDEGDNECYVGDDDDDDEL